MESTGRLRRSIVGSTEKELCGFIHPHNSIKHKNESDVNTVVHSDNEQSEEHIEGANE